MQELLRSLYKYFYTLCQIVKLSLALKPLFICSFVHLFTCSLVHLFLSSCSFTCAFLYYMYLRVCVCVCVCKERATVQKLKVFLVWARVNFQSDYSTITNPHQSIQTSLKKKWEPKETKQKIGATTSNHNRHIFPTNR